ncbi:hypothetical protein CMI41_04290 [Candidatus Pacearchaeota archaeon]|nr:hypothetical protein [Candidatus Pacearchaeota archaeon]|tara:strand:- start:5568 stop:6239 length:672 start_codon:yes stop_codon:yes gene_type:complete
MEEPNIVYCLHGNEKCGLEVAKSLPSIPSFLGNKKAFEENKRFIEADLNRVFPGKKDGNYEERAAYQLLKKLKDRKYVIDIHSSSNKCPLFGIITSPNREKIEFAKKLGLKRLVIMPPSFAKKRALIDFVEIGISLEIGPHNRQENVTEILGKIQNFVEGQTCLDEMEIFEVFDVIRRSETDLNLENFDFVERDSVKDYGFTAVLVNEDSYGDILCLAARRIS